ncbi:MAG: hypothetical protein CSA65_09575 [Proteobacteria bacterium]|nr:MAG: hypothetical protein CSB49_01435 [Pseudomonadota bacterium]PIE17173.1 MAG: hypothetical protein CSA65_09575 [Pseudomonadota bacterium]
MSTHRNTLLALSLACFASSAALLAGCGSEGTLELSIVLPEGQDPLAGVDQLSLSITRQSGQTTAQVKDSQSFSLELEAEVASEISSILLEGLKGGKLVARGETPRIVLRPVDDAFKLLVGPAGAFAGLRPRLQQSGLDPASAVLRGLGVLFAGGRDAQTGAPLASAAVYDVFEHRLVPTTPALPEPRAGAVAAACGAECGVVALGRRSASELSTSLLRYIGGSWRSYDDGLEASQRREGAAIAELSSGDSLVVGGLSAAGVAQATLLRLSPGSSATTPSIRALASPARVARSAPVVASSGAIVLIAGGQAEGEAPVELFFASSQSTQVQPLSRGPVPASGSAAVSLGDGRFALLGGQTATGDFIADGWLIDAVAQTVKHVPNALKTARAGHRAARVGTQLVVVGGQTTTGLAADAELLGTDTLQGVGTTPLQAPRAGHWLWSIAPGTLLVAAGAANGDAVELLETFQSGVTN